MLFFNKEYAQANSPHYETTPRTFLLSMAAMCPPHALLVAHWGTEGGAVLSVPTKEYFQSSGWVEERLPPPPPPPASVANGAQHLNGFAERGGEAPSVRSGSGFWAAGRATPSSNAFTAFGSTGGHYMSETDESDKSLARGAFGAGARGAHRFHTRQGHGTNESSQFTQTTEEDDADSQGTEMPGREHEHDGVVDEVGAQDAFIAGMIYALSRKMCPGLPYTPAWSGEDDASAEDSRGRWRLDECLR